MGVRQWSGRDATPSPASRVQVLGFNNQTARIKTPFSRDRQSAIPPLSFSHSLSFSVSIYLYLTPSRERRAKNYFTPMIHSAG